MNRRKKDLLSKACVEVLEIRRLLSGTGLTDAVYHGSTAYTNGNVPNPNPNAGLVDSVFGGDNAAVARVVAYAASHTPNYTFANTNDRFVYGGGSGANISTVAFLAGGVFGATGDATGAAVNDPADAADTIFDAQGYFQTPTANDGGTYTVKLGVVDDVVAVYIGGNGTPGSGTLVASGGWQSASAGLPGFQISLPAGASSSAQANIPIEIIYGNGFGDANLDAVSASNPSTGVQILDPNQVQVTTFNTAPTNEPLATAPTLSGTPSSNSVLLNWNSTFLANTYSVFRYVAGSSPSTAINLVSGLTTPAYTDTTAVNGTTYNYYVNAVNANGASTSSAPAALTPTNSPTAPVTFLTATRTNATTVQISFTAPPAGTQFTITRSTTLGGTQTTLTPVGGQTATTFTDTSAPTTGNTDYYYTVTSVNSAGPSAPVTAFAGHGEGFAADYYSSNTADPNQTGTHKPLTGDDPTSILSFERIDSTIAVPPASTPPGWNAIQPNPNDDFAIRWVGFIEAPLTGFYSFSVNGVDDREQITVYDPNHLTGGKPTPVNISPAGHTMSGFGDTYTVPVVGTNGTPFQLTAGQKYLVQIDYNQGFGGLVANLSWAASSSAANATAGTFDVMASQTVPTFDVVAPTPAFSTVDASGTVTKDQSYYTFTATGNNNVVQLQWDNIPADSYNLYRSTSQNGPYTLLNSSPIAATTNSAPLTFNDTTAVNGTAYFYILTGVTQNGETAITLSNGTTSGLKASATPVAVAPATPTGVIVSGTNSTTQGVQVVVSFPAVPFAASYIVQRAPESPAGSGTPGAFATVPGGGAVTGSGSTISFNDSDPTLQSNLNYFYRVIAVNGALQSSPSTPVKLNAIGAPLNSEGTVEVEAEASGYATGSTSTIVNLGNQGGQFNAVGGAIAVGPVTDANGITYQAFQFSGSNSATSSFNSPTDLNGNSQRSIELWVDNPTIDTNEESTVSWSHRGGNPDGSNMSFSYGTQYGVGLWGGEYDLQWNTTAPGVSNTSAPTANTWHYLVFTYDGTFDNVYVDGQLDLQQTVALGGLETFAGFPVNLAAQNSSTTAGTFAAALRGSIDLASVRIENGALTANDVATNYVSGVPGRLPATAAPTTAPTLNPIPTNGTLKLTWSYDPNAFSYDIYRSDAAHPTPVAIATNLTSLTFTDTTASAGITYTYFVTSVNNIGQGPASNSESGGIQALTTAPVLNSPAVGNNTVTLSWSADPNAASYDVYRSDPAHPTPAAVATGLTALTYTDSSVVNGTTYTYYVTSVNSVSQGPPSNMVMATPAQPGPFGPLNILTHHEDSTNDGLNAQESVLSPTNVNPTDFGKQYTMALDGGDVIASPLYMQNVNITSGANQGIHSVVFVATEADGLYAVDANTGAVLWHDNFTNITNPTILTPTTGVSTILQSDIAGNPDVGSQLGILATPAIDPNTGIMYLNANTKEIRGDGKHFVQRLWAVSINSGASVMTPAVIGDTIAPNGLSGTGPYTYVSGPIVNGTGNNNPAGNPTPVYPDTDGWAAAPGGASGYVVAFNAIEQMERTAVSLINGSVYLGFASHGDDGPYYGWVLGFNASNLALNAAFNTTPTFEPSSVVGDSTPFQQLGGVWMSGSVIASDGTNLYLVTGNGAFNGTPSNFDANGFPIDHDYADSLLKLTPDSSTSSSQNGNGWGLKVSDYFTPSNQFELNTLDLDLGSGGATLLPNNILDAAGNPLIVVGGKESRVYVVDRNNMGKYNFSYPTGATNVNPAPFDRVVAEYANNGTNTGGEQIYSSATYYNGNIYIGVKGTPALEFNVSNLATGGSFTPIKTSLSFGYPGETFIASSDANSAGVVWAENPGGNDLLAYDASNFTTPIYDSNTAAGDGLGGSIHFHVPMEANGMVYAGSRGGGLGGYGLKLTYLMSDPTFFSAPTGLSSTAISSNDTHLSWTSNSSLATEFRIDRAIHGSTTFTTVAYVGNSNRTYDDTSVNTSTVYDYRVVAISGVNSTSASNTAATVPVVIPAIVSTQVGDGSVQRSSVKSFSITFNTAVNFTSSSFSIFQATLDTSGNNSTVAGYTNDVSADFTVSTTDHVTWTFTGIAGGPLDRNLSGGAGFLVDGIYRLVLHGAAVTDQASGTAALGTGDQLATFANSESGGTGTSQAFHVLYGDINGDGTVTNGDLNKFRQAFTPTGGTYDPAFDFNNDGFINNSDLNTFRKRFLESFSY